MKASVLDFRRRMKDILQALDKNETVTILHRGKKKGIIFPAGLDRQGARPIAAHPVFGMWKDRKDLSDVRAVMRKLREGRRSAV
jgi:hypothetical protein